MNKLIVESLSKLSGITSEPTSLDYELTYWRAKYISPLNLLLNLSLSTRHSRTRCKSFKVSIHGLVISPIYIHTL